MEYPKINVVLPTIGEACAMAAYERFAALAEAGSREHPPAHLPWGLLPDSEKHGWEAVAMAAVTEYQAQLAAGLVNDEWHKQVVANQREAALRELCTKG